MHTVLWAAFAAALLAALLRPHRPGGRAERWRGTAFAHRGLHGGEAGENTPEAFERACRAGFGIELDVRLTGDGEVVVFHDEDLSAFGRPSLRVDAAALSELKSLPGAGTAFPTLSQTLRLVDGRVPLLLELKHGRRNALLCRKTAALLAGYGGPVLVESFHPGILLWFRLRVPDLPRGQLVGTHVGRISRCGAAGRWLADGIARNGLARPDFVAVQRQVRLRPRCAARVPLAPWTVRDPEGFRQSLARGEMPIFEGFDPEAPE